MSNSRPATMRVSGVVRLTVSLVLALALLLPSLLCCPVPAFAANGWTTVEEADNGGYDQASSSPSVSLQASGSWRQIEIAPGLAGLAVQQVNSRYVLYTAGTDDDRDIYYYDIAAGRSRRVTQESLSRSLLQLQMDGNWIVYSRKMGESHNVFLYDTLSASTRQITNSKLNITPRVSGDYVVYRGGVNADMDIYVYRISSGTTTRITSIWEQQGSAPYWDGDSDYLSIDPPYVAWRGYLPGAEPGQFDMDVVVYDLRKPPSDPSAWLRIGTDFVDASPQVHNGRVVWNQYGGSPSVNRMCMYEMSSGASYYDIISEPGVTAYFASPEPWAVDDQRAVWIEATSGGGTEVHVRKFGVVDTVFGTTAYCTDARLGDTVVAWQGQAKLGEAGEVYACAFAEAETVQLSSPSQGNALAKTGRLLGPDLALGVGNVAWASEGRSTIHLATVNPPLSVVRPFADVGVDHHYREAVENLFWEAVVDGRRIERGLRYYDPAESVNRAQFAKMIVGALRKPVEAEGAYSPFKDLGAQDATTRYPHEYVATIYRYDITQGTTPTTYGPWDPLTRFHVITMLVRAAKNLDPDALAEPPIGWEGQLSKYYGNQWHGENLRLAEYNLLLDNIEGLESGWNPEHAASRAEVAQFMWNYMLLTWFTL